MKNGQNGDRKFVIDIRYTTDVKGNLVNLLYELDGKHHMIFIRINE